MKKQLILILFLLTVSIAVAGEIRSLWIVPWDISCPSDIDQMIADAVSARQNELLVEVRYRSDALYTPNRLSNKYHNPEPKSYVLKDPSFDALDYILKKAKPLGFSVQAWVVVFNATPVLEKRLKENYIYQNHQNWITWDNKGRLMDAKTHLGYFIDPGIPAVQDYTLEVLSDLVSGYPELDGLHLDYIRYPNQNLGYHPTSRSRFEAAQRKDRSLSFNDWRTSLITEFVRKCHQRIKEINPYIQLTAAVISDITQAKRDYAQNWTDWLKEGIIDKVYPMAYNVIYDTFEAELKRPMLPEYKDKIVVGLRAWDANGLGLMPQNNPQYNIYDIQRRIDYIREQDFSGIALFSYSGLKVDDALYALAESSYPPLERDILLASALPVETEISLSKEPQEPLLDDLVELASFEEGLEEAATAIPIISGKHFNFTPLLGSYEITLSLPFEGRWLWQIYSEEGRLLYERKGLYLGGENIIYWNAILNDGSQALELAHHLKLSSLSPSSPYEIEESIHLE